MKRILSAIFLLLAAVPSVAQERGGVGSELALSSGLRFHSNPDFDQQGDGDFQFVSHFRYGLSSETRRAKLAFSVEGEFNAVRLSRGEANLTYFLLSAASELTLQSFARQEDSGGLSIPADDFDQRRQIDLSAPGGRARTAGLSGVLETARNRQAGIALAVRGVTRRGEFRTGGRVERSRRIEVRSGFILLPNQLTEAPIEISTERQNFSGAAQRTEQQSALQFTLRSDLNTGYPVEAAIGLRRIRSETGGVTTRRNGTGWSFAVTRERDWGDLSAQTSQRQHLPGSAREKDREVYLTFEHFREGRH